MALLVPLAALLTFGSLYSGIGGADLGLLGMGWGLAWQVERDPLKRAVLAQRWPAVLRSAEAADAVSLPRVDVLHCEPQEPTEEHVQPALRAIAALRPPGVIIDLASGRLPSVYLGCYRVLHDHGYSLGGVLLRYQTSAIVREAQHASHVRTRVLILGTLPPAPPPSDLGAEPRAVLFAVNGAWDPAIPAITELELGSDELERVRLLPDGWTSDMPEPARYAALRAATVPHVAAFAAAALLGRVA